MAMHRPASRQAPAWVQEPRSATRCLPGPGPRSVLARVRPPFALGRVSGLLPTPAGASASVVHGSAHSGSKRSRDSSHRTGRTRPWLPDGGTPPRLLRGQRHPGTSSSADPLPSVSLVITLTVPWSRPSQPLPPTPGPRPRRCVRPGGSICRDPLLNQCRRDRLCVAQQEGGLGRQRPAYPREPNRQPSGQELQGHQ